ncbi:hypothetical protein GCM10027347_12020 [Larkinella harenae]
MVTLALVSLAMGLVRCKRNADEPEPSAAGRKLLELHLAGIPDKNITIDQEKRIVTILMPSTFPADEIKATYKLSADTRIVDGIKDGYLRARHLSRCYEPRIVLQKTPYSPEDFPVEYRIETRSAGKLTPNPTAPLEMILGDLSMVTIPFENLYGSVPVVDALVTREGGPEKISLLHESSSSNCVFFYHTEVANQLRLSSTRQLPPGRYTLELVQKDSTVVAVPQPLVIKKGEAWLRMSSGLWGVLPGEPFRIDGYNLFQGDASLTIEGQEKSYHPVLTDFFTNGTGFTVVPPVLDPGVYFIKLFDQGKEITCMKLTILRHKGQPVLMGLGSYLPCMNYDSYPFKRGAKVGVNYAPSTAGLQPDPVRLDERLQFSRVGHTAEKYDLPIVLYRDFMNPAYVIIPDSMPQGKYEVRLLLKDPKTGELVSSEVYERIIDVQ